MQVATGTASSRSIHSVTKQIIKDVISNINGTPDFLLVAFTPYYEEKRKYETAMAKICEESGTKKILGGTFPAVATSNDIPTTQGCSVIAIQSNEIDIHSPFSYSNIRVKPEKGTKNLCKIFNANKKVSKSCFFLTPGPFFQPNAIEQMKVLDTYFAHKFKKMFNFIGKLIDKSMGKNGYGMATFADIILQKLLENGVKNAIGGATIDINMKSCLQFKGENVLNNALVGTIFSSDKLSFSHNWTFDKSQRSKTFQISEFLNSGYIQKINTRPAQEAFFDLIGIPKGLYEEAFKKCAYASLLYLSALKSKEGDNLPFVSMCQPILNGIASTIPERILKESNKEASFFTQSGAGIQKSAYECAKKTVENISKPEFGIFINCSNRLLIAGDKIEEENKKIKEAIGDNAPFITLYSGGEFSIIDYKPIFTAVSVHGMIVGHNKNATKNVVF
jgi:hypothetical protein